MQFLPDATACEELGIEIIFASSPQGKGRIERAFDTLQDRLIPELRLNNITDMTGANSYLQHVFIPQFWRKNLIVKSKTSNTEYTPVSRYINLDDICITKVYRKIRNDHTFSFKGKLYFIDSPLKHSIANQKIEIRTSKNKRFDAYFAGRKLQVTEITEPEKLSSEDYEIQKKLEVLALADRLGNVAEAYSRTTKKLNKFGIYTGYDLKNADISWIKKTFTVVLARTVEELRGKSAVELKDVNDSRDRICVSQSMGKPVIELTELSEAVTAHATKAAFKLRRFKSYTSAITIFIHTDSFRQAEPQYHKSQSIKLPYPTADTSTLVSYASFALKAIYKKGFKYKKAGVIFEELSLHDDMQQLELLSETLPLNISSKTLVIDEINRKFGRSAIKLASEGFSQSWRPKDDLAPLSYTTKLSDLPIAKA